MALCCSYLKPILINLKHQIFTFIVTATVELYVVERANRAILIDASPPQAGNINDGPLLTEDMMFTNNARKVYIYTN